MNKINLQDAIEGKWDAALNLALCEWLGMKVRKDGSWYRNDQFGCEDGSTTPNHITAPESLGLLHEVEKKLKPNQWIPYIDHLSHVAGFTYDETVSKAEAELDYSCRICSATARQRVIAIFLTIEPEVFKQ